MKTDHEIPSRLLAIVDHELEQGEKVQWMEMPVRHFFRSGTAVTLAMGLLIITACGAFATEPIWYPWAFGTPVEFSNIVFASFAFGGCLVGVWLTITPIWVYQASCSTIYVITDQRAISIVGGWSTTIRSYLAADLGQFYRKEHRDGTGDVIIDERYWRDSDGDRSIEALGFERVRNAKQVEQLIWQLADRRVKVARQSMMRKSGT